MRKKRKKLLKKLRRKRKKTQFPSIKQLPCFYEKISEEQLSSIPEQDREYVKSVLEDRERVSKLWNKVVYGRE